jgi:hypothetical protein
VTPDQDLSLVLCFYPADWSPVCGDQVTLYNEILSEFHKHEAELLGICLVSSGFREGSAAALSAAGGFQAEGRGGPRLR